MFSRLRTTWMASSGALLLVLVLAGGALGATVLTAASTPESETDPSVETLATFEDLDGDGIDDDCDQEVVENADAAAAAHDAVDTDGDGTISVPEAAHSDRIGGPNCNHGGYVSQVAHGDDEACEAPTEVTDPVEPIATPTDTPVVEVGAELDEQPAEGTEDAAPAACEAEETAEDEAAETACEATEVPPFDPATRSFGAYVSSVAQSDAVGGKNCNHGGAVSEAVKAAKEAAREARDAAKAERAAERAAAKAERQAKREAAKAERAAAKAERAAAKAGKSHGKGNPHGGD
jgi:hypothetical protein